MILRPIVRDIATFPNELIPIISGARLFDSSCSELAKVIYIDKGNGYFLKSSPKGSLKQEAAMTEYFHTKGLAAQVIDYISDECDWMLTQKVQGQDCISKMYLDNPTRLCDTIGERLAMLHSIEYSNCPVMNRISGYLNTAENNYRTGNYDKSAFPDSFGYVSAEEAWRVVERDGHLLQSNTLLHGDYCLPNIILDNWKFSGFIDVDNGGVGDRHIDIFWGAWTLFFNLQTHKYRERFIDAYGRSNVNEDILHIVAAVEVFG